MNMTNDVPSKKSKRLTLEDRKKIESLLHSNWKIKDIAKEVGVYPSTVHRDLNKCREAYNAEEAHEATCRGFHPIDWDIIGKRFGLLTVEDYANIYKKRTWWKCRCECGKSTIVSRKKLLDYCSKRRPLSCGCIAKQHGAPGKDFPIEESSLRKFQDLISHRKINRECWEWTGYMQNGNIPKTSWRTQAMSVRKCMYLIVNGLSNECEAVHATCRNRKCFNPDHLALGAPPQRKWYNEEIV